MMLTLEKIQYKHRPLAYYAMLTGLQVRFPVDPFGDVGVSGVPPPPPPENETIGSLSCF